MLHCSLHVQSRYETVSGYGAVCQELTEWARSGLPVAASLRGELWPPGWDPPSFAANLHLASQGLGPGLDQHADKIKALLISMGPDTCCGT